MLRCLAATAAFIALATPASFAFATVTAVTPVNTFGNTNGTERCLVGDGSDRCTRGGTYLGAYSITAVFSAWTGRTLTRVDDSADRVWSAGAFDYIEIAGIAHYLSNSGSSSAGIWVDDGRFSAGELNPFPAGTAAWPADNRTIGTVLPGESVTSDLLTGRVFETSFVAMVVGAAPFEFVYRSRFTNGSVEYFSSDKTSGGFDNRAVHGKTLDHMVTWYAGQRIDSRQNVADVYLIAFERAHQDDDFQDAVYAVSLPLGTAPPVPEPPIWAALGLGFMLTAWLRSRGAL